MIVQDASQALDEPVSLCLVVCKLAYVYLNLPSVEIISRTRGAAGAAMLLILMFGCVESIAAAAG